MDISQILKSSTAGTNSAGASTQTAEQKAAQAAAKLSPASLAINKAGNRIQSQLDTTTAQLSAYGKLKSAVSDAQLAAKGLSGLTAASPAADVKAAVTKLVSTFNTAITTGKATASLADSGGIKRVGNELGRAISANHAVFDAMKKIGFKQLSDGSLSLDTAKFEAAQKANPGAVEATLDKLGSLVNKVASKELATDSAVAGSIEALNQRTSLLKTQKNAMSSLLQQMVSPSASSTGTGFGGYGVSAYQANT